MRHTVAYSESHDNTANEDITPVPDQIMAIQNGHFVPQVDCQINWAAPMSAVALRARLSSPSIRQVTQPYLIPVIDSVGPLTTDKAVDLRSNPIMARALEELAVESTLSAVGPTRDTIVVDLADSPLAPAPSGQAFTIRGTGTTTQVASNWTLCSITWANNLPVGRYAVIGGIAYGATCQAFRVIFENQTWRPGGLGWVSEVVQADPLFRYGELGMWGTFQSNRMPNIEMLASAADAAQTVYLDLVRI